MRAAVALLLMLLNRPQVSGIRVLIFRNRVVGFRALYCFLCRPTLPSGGRHGRVSVTGLVLRVLRRYGCWGL